MPIIARDRDYTQPQEQDAPEFEYPFEMNGDFSSFILRRRYKQTRAAFTANRPLPGTVADSEFAQAYLMATSGIAQTPTALVGFQRTFATIPADQITYGSRVITKPAVSTVGVAINLQSVTGSGTSSNLGANTEYNSHVWDTVNRRIYGPDANVSHAVSGGDLRVTWTAHGLAGTERISMGLVSSTRYLFSTGQYTIIDANTIDLLGFSFLAGSVNRAGKYLRDYTSGTDRVGIRLTQKFYLPGITAGISSPTSIPLPDVLLNDTSLLVALTTYLTGYQTYDATELIRWNDWPIYTQTLIEINMADL